MEASVETVRDEALESDSDDEPEIYDDDLLSSIGISFDDRQADLLAKAPGVEDYNDVDDSFITIDVLRAVEEI